MRARAAVVIDATIVVSFAPKDTFAGISGLAIGIRMVRNPDDPEHMSKPEHRSTPLKAAPAPNLCDPLHRNLSSLPQATLSCRSSTPGLSACLTGWFPWCVGSLHPGHGSCPTAGRSCGSSCEMFLWVTEGLLSVSGILVQTSHRNPATILIGAAPAPHCDVVDGFGRPRPVRAPAERRAPSPAARPCPGRSVLRAFPRGGHGRGTGSRPAGTCRSPRSRSGSGGNEDDG